MKSLKMMLTIVAAMMAAVACGSKMEAQKVLVVYYSQTANTKAVAEEIAIRLGADIEAIVAVNPYDGDYRATIERSGKEREEGILPEIKPMRADIAKYDVIFIGYPIWFGTFAPPVATFLNQTDLSGKKIVPFCTFGSGGLDSSVKNLAEKQPNAEILPGYGVRAARMKAVPQEVDQFLKANGFVKGDLVKLDEFSEPHPVSEAEAAIFDAAVGDYPMIRAKAETVATRTLPNGMEYLFTAANLPPKMPTGMNRPQRPNGGNQAEFSGKDRPQRPAGGRPQMPGRERPKRDRDNSKMPPADPMKVYVTVIDGEAPVFTQVVR